MDKDFSLWAIGILCSFIGALLLILLKLVLDSQRESGKKLDAQGVAITEIKTTLNGESGLVMRVNRLHDARSREQADRLQAEIMENAELRTQLDEARRQGHTPHPV